MQGDKVGDKVGEEGTVLEPRHKGQEGKSHRRAGEEPPGESTVQRPRGTETACETESRSVWPEFGRRGSERRGPMADVRGGGPL